MAGKLHSRAAIIAQDQGDPPLWIDFDADSLAATERVRAANPSLLRPSSRCYRYSARDPGIACLRWPGMSIVRHGAFACFALTHCWKHDYS
ncbi:hypothetical protein J3F83DRAFT_757656 [Trichoderma novae-zelandiae]